MIKKALPYVIILLFPLIYSCDQLEELKTWDLNTEAGKDFEVNISEIDPSTFSTTFSVSLATNPDIQEYINKIKEYRVNKVTYQIWTYSGPPEGDVLLSGTFKLGSINILLDKVNLNQMYNNQTITTLDLTDQELVDLAKMLESNKSVSGSLAGEVTDKPVYFIIYVEFDLTLRVEA